LTYECRGSLYRLQGRAWRQADTGSIEVHLLG
jgi:hypothetical protein